MASSPPRSLLLAIKSWFLVRPIRIMILLYTIGIVWHCLHPIASMLTGDLHHARRWYIDESSLDPSHFQMLMKYELIQNTKTTKKKKQLAIRSLCQGLLVYNSKIPCYRHSTHDDDKVHLEIVKVTPSTTAGVSPVGEAIVIVIPPILVPFSLHTSSNNKSHAQFHASILQLIHRLSYTSPWLSKTVLFVSPRVKKSTNNMDSLLEKTVTTFLDAYLGTTQQQHHEERLSMDITGAILRTLLVVDLNIFTSPEVAYPTTLEEAEDYEPLLPNELRILPQGRRGVLPNMDLVFLVRTVYERSQLLAKQQLTVQVKQRYTMVQMASHIYTTECTNLGQSIFTKFLEPYLPESIHESVEDWVLALLNMMAFEKTLAVGPYPPHAPALERGMDALTIQGHFQEALDSDDYDPLLGNRPRTKQSPQDYPRELVQRLEFIVRSLSNLHERLHHSTHLYLLLSPPHRFVKHEEYLVPNLLLILPLLVRLASILLPQENNNNETTIKEKNKKKLLELKGVIVAMMMVGIGTWFFSWAVQEYNNMVLLPVYLLLCSTACLTSRSVQCAACLVATCMHVALAFGHVSLSFPSALFWTPLLAFPYFSGGRSKTKLAVGIMVLACLPWITCNTPYMQYIFMPLYMFVALLFLSP